jgi:hypothetical protein
MQVKTLSRGLLAVIDVRPTWSTASGHGHGRVLRRGVNVALLNGISVSINTII